VFLAADGNRSVLVEDLGDGLPLAGSGVKLGRGSSELAALSIGPIGHPGIADGATDNFTIGHDRNAVLLNWGSTERDGGFREGIRDIRCEVPLIPGFSGIIERVRH